MAFVESPPLEASKFTGGMVDDPSSANPSQYQKADNLIVNEDGDLVSRPGSVLFDVSNAQLPSGNQRVSALINFNRDTELFATSGSHLYRYNSGWSEIHSPGSGDGLPTV